MVAESGMIRGPRSTTATIRRIVRPCPYEAMAANFPSAASREPPGRQQLQFEIGPV
jgi:hypothetical protein